MQDAFQKGRQFASGAPPILGRHISTAGLDHGTAAIGVGGFVERIDGRQSDSAALIDQIDSAEVLAGVTHGNLAEVPVPGRNLEPHPFKRDRAVALTLAPLDFQAKRHRAAIR